MPYIKKDDRLKFDTILDKLPDFKTKGELEYCIYKLMNHYMSTREERYSNLHDTVYATIHCGDEFRRRRLDKREDEAIESNGDV